MSRPVHPKPLQAYVEHLGELCLHRSGPTDCEVTGASVDSRTIQPGEIFCAIPGAREDGASYVEMAARAGARAVVAERPLPVPAGVTFIEVTDAYAAAGRLAEVAHDFPARALRLIGVTGTNGKTTCASLLRDIVQRAGTRAGLLGTIHYVTGCEDLPAQRTTPPAPAYQKLLRDMVDSGLDTAIIEVSSHALDQHRMGRGQFAGAIFTNLTRDHLDYHRTFEDYYQAKKRLFAEYLLPGAAAVVNADDPFGARLASELTDCHAPVTVSTFGETEADYGIRDVALSVRGCTCRLTGPDLSLHLQSPMIGRHNVSNITASSVMALRLGVEARAIAHAVHDFSGAPGRLQPVRSSGGFTVFVDYAHTDDALRNVLRALSALRPARLVAVFGCGGDRDRTKRPLMGAAASSLADMIYVTTDNPRTEEPVDIIAEVMSGIPGKTPCETIVDRREAIRAAVRGAAPGDIILVAGKGHENYQEIKGRQYPFDDISEVRAAMQEAEVPPLRAEAGRTHTGGRTGCTDSSQ